MSAIDFTFNISLFIFNYSDRTVKVWDFNGSAADEEALRNLALPSSQSTNGLHALAGLGAGSGQGSGSGVSGGGMGISVNPQKPLYVLHTPTAVGRISWRPSSLTDDRYQRNQLQLATSSPDRGEISVWDVNMSNIPVCILKGHSNEACTGISWLDTPLHSTSSPSSSSVQSASNAADNKSTEKCFYFL